MINGDDFRKLVDDNKKKCLESILTVSERRPHHMLLACVADDGQIMVVKIGGNQGIEALMGLAIQTTLIDQCRKNLAL